MRQKKDYKSKLSKKIKKAMDEENKTQVEYNPEIFKNKHG